MAAKRNSRYGFIDAVRGIAACFVMLQHSLYESGLLGEYPIVNPSTLIPKYLELGETGVVAFFLVSGFVIPLSLERIKDVRLFWVHRACRIYPLYLVIFFVTFLLERGAGIHGFKALADNIASHLLFIQEYTHQRNFVGGAWTLSLEMVWYICFSGAALLTFNRRTNLLVIASIGITLFAQISCASGHHLPMGRLSMLLCCVLGLVCYRLEQGELARRHFFLLATGLVGMIALNLLLGFLLFPSREPTASFMMVADSWTVAAVIFFVAFATRHSEIWSHSILSFLGQISYSVYLVHPVVLLLLSMTAVSGLTLMVATFAITISVSTLSYHFVERPPIRFGHSLGSALAVHGVKV